MGSGTLFNLVGSQTTHRVNSIAVQLGKFGCVPTERAPRKKDVDVLLQSNQNSI